MENMEMLMGKKIPSTGDVDEWEILHDQSN